MIIARDFILLLTTTQPRASSRKVEDHNAILRPRRDLFLYFPKDSEIATSVGLKQNPPRNDRGFLHFVAITLLLLFTSIVASAETYEVGPSIDNRIKTYIYSPNDVYMLVLHYGFQTHIEFAEKEEVETISIGDAYAWKISPIGNRLFIRPVEKNIYTNMTIITNKRSYQFDLVAKEFEEGDEKDLVYIVKFYYPSKKREHDRTE
jgi:type IV secretion system protein VirB9